MVDKKCFCERICGTDNAESAGQWTYDLYALLVHLQNLRTDHDGNPAAVAVRGGCMPAPIRKPWEAK